MMASSPFPLKVEEAFGVKGKVVIVTGAAGLIGQGIAEAFAVNGAKVVCSDRAGRRLDTSLQRLCDQGGQAIAVPADFARPEELHNLVDAAVQHYGGLDDLINCGGIPGSGRLIDDTAEDFDKLYHANVRSLWLLSKHAIVPMAQRGGGSIVNIASIHGHRALGFCSLYAGTKAAVLATTQEMAVELAPQHIRVNSVSPGWIADSKWRFQGLLEQLQEPFRSQIAREFAHLADEPPTTGLQPLTVAGTKFDIAMACLYLCAPAARFITGTDLLIDGGKLHEMPQVESRLWQKPASPWMALRPRLQQLPEEAWASERPRWAKSPRPQSAT
jgi:NAD(P)-dependent dehydrogenase (short-subunit alcohol dehydrogenase family)